VVGDDDQSIYGWRGADVGNILDFERYFPGAEVVKLETNYRSRSQILDVANAVISQSRGKRHGKTLRSAKGPGRKVRVVALADSGQEAKFVVSEIRALAKGTDASPGGQRVRFGNVAVLYRSNQTARLLEEELRIGGIPYRLFGGTQFFDRKEVKDAVAYLRVLVSPRDELSLRRALVNPSRGIGQQTMARARAHASRTGITFAQAMRQLDELDVPSRAKQSAHRFFAAVDHAHQGLRSERGLVEVTRKLLTDTGYMGSIESDDSSHGKRRRENIDFLLRAIERYERRSKAERGTLPQFLNSLTLRAEEEEEKDPGNQVTLSSLHSSKGLEFDVVFLIGCVEGQLPHSRTTDPKVTEAAPTDVDEERRLFYVGVTRARELLYLTRPQRRTMRGRVRPRVPSRFLEGFPDDAWEAYAPHGEQPMESQEVVDMASAILDRLRS
jgi:DNA helicase-2/ATP-dependent DNA helicase PcrA